MSTDDIKTIMAAKYPVNKGIKKFEVKENFIKENFENEKKDTRDSTSTLIVLSLLFLILSLPQTLMYER